MGKNSIVPILCLMILAFFYWYNPSKELELSVIKQNDSEFHIGHNDKTKYGSSVLVYKSNCSAGTRKTLEKGSKLIHQESLDEAETVFKELLSKEPSCYSALVSLGTIYAYKQDFWNADAMYRRALKVKPDSATVYKSLGVLYSEAKGYQAGLPHLIKALEIEPDLALAHWAIGVNYYALENYELSHDHLLKFIKLAPSSTHVNRAKEFISNIERI